MEYADQARLNYNRKAILEGIKPKPIATFLLQEEILSGGDYDVIVKAGTDVEQMTKLLEILVQRGPNAYSKFREITSKEYEWIVRGLDQTPPQELEKSPQDEKNTKDDSSGMGNIHQGDTNQTFAGNGSGHQGNVIVSGSGTNITYNFLGPAAASANPASSTSSSAGQSQDIPGPNMKFDSKHFVKVAKLLNNLKWINVGRSLYLDEMELRSIQNDHRHEGYSECAQRMLNQWLENDPDDCTFGRLCKALKENNLNRTVLELHSIDYNLPPSKK